MECFKMEPRNGYDDKPIIAGSNMSVELCLVCGDRASGRHYGAISCEGCKGFFKRSIRKQLGYQCRGTMNCEVTKHHRNRCQFCRLQKCLASGMRSDSVQHERKPILEKKESQNTTNNTSNTTIHGNNSSSQSFYHNRNKFYLNSNTPTHHSSTVNAAAAAAVASNILSAENISAAAAAAAAVFPVGFNFADLTQTLSKRGCLLTSNSYQHQSQQNSNYMKYSSGIQPNDDEEDSMDNNSTSDTKYLGQNISGGDTSGMGFSGNSGGAGGGDICGGGGGELSITPVPVITNISTAVGSTSATSTPNNIIQTTFEKTLLTQSLDLIATIQQQYENNINDSNVTNNCQNLDENDEMDNSGCNNSTLIKEELIIDDHSSNLEMTINRDDDYSQDQQHQQLLHQQNQHHHNQMIDLPILPEANVNFNLQSPSMVPSYLNVHYVCESGSRLLFLSVYWIKKIPSFQQLSEDLQIQLLRYHWVELFTIGLAQCSRTLSVSTIMTTLSAYIIQLTDLEKSNVLKIRKMSEHIYRLHDFVQTMQSMSLDDYEYAYIRLIIIFNADGLYIKDQTKRTFIDKLQEISVSSLKSYYQQQKQQQQQQQNSQITPLTTNSSSSNNNSNNNNNNNNNLNDRCIKILLRLMQLRSLESDIIEELFFSNLVGQIQIESMIPYVLKLGGGGV